MLPAALRPQPPARAARSPRPRLRGAGLPPEPQPPPAATSPDPALPALRPNGGRPRPRPDAGLASQLHFPAWTLEPILLWGLEHGRLGARRKGRAATGTQRRRPVAGACPSPQPAGNLGGALGASECAAAAASWGERVQGAAWRAGGGSWGRGGGAGPRLLPGAAGYRGGRVPQPGLSGDCSPPTPGGSSHPTGSFRQPAPRD